MPEPNGPHPVATFSGLVTCTRTSSAALTLSGAARDVPAERLVLTFTGVASCDVPATVTDARVTRVDGRTYRLESPPAHWLIRARALHLHRDVRAEFFRAVPPRRVPLGKRLFWRALLWLAARRSGLRLLGALRGR